MDIASGQVNANNTKLVHAHISSPLISLRAEDVDCTRMLLHVHHGKGAKDRHVLLPRKTLELLRGFWKTHRNPTLPFSSPSRSGLAEPVAVVPRSQSSV